MATYGVKIPIAGHVYIEVEADNEDDAIDKAFDCNIETRMIEEWDTLRQVNKGNVCYFPKPWEPKAEIVDDGESED